MQQNFIASLFSQHVPPLPLRRWVLLLALICGSSACAPEAPEASDSQSPAAEAGQSAQSSLEGERITAEIPSGWLKVRDTQLQMLHIREYVPPDTGETWTEKLTIEATTGDPLPDPLEFVLGWAADQSNQCIEFRDNAIFSGMENGHPTVVRLLECFAAKRTRKPIVTMVKVIQGQEALYTVTRIWRLETNFDPEVGKLALAPNAIANWSDALSRTTACTPGHSEHPCHNNSSNDRSQDG